MPNKDIAARLHLSPKTVERYLSVAYEKLNAGNRTDAVLRALGSGHTPGMYARGAGAPSTSRFQLATIQSPLAIWREEPALDEGLQLYAHTPQSPSGSSIGGSCIRRGAVELSEPSLVLWRHGAPRQVVDRLPGQGIGSLEDLARLLLPIFDGHGETQDCGHEVERKRHSLAFAITLVDPQLLHLP